MNDPDFNKLNLKISKLITTYPIEKQREIFNYLNQLDDINKKGYNIAYEHLDTSFDIYKSNGFKKWKNNLN
jgi:hypothetical protein